MCTIFIWPRRGPVTDCYEHGNESSGSVKDIMSWPAGRLWAPQRLNTLETGVDRFEKYFSNVWTALCCCRLRSSDSFTETSSKDDVSPGEMMCNACQNATVPPHLMCSSHCHVVRMPSFQLWSLPPWKERFFVTVIWQGTTCFMDGIYFAGK